MTDAGRCKWVVSGLDRFSNEWYPVACYADKGDALDDAAVRSDMAHVVQPGGLEDTFSVLSMGEATRVFGLDAADVLRLVEAMQ